jgi:hypothetical protein
MGQEVNDPGEPAMQVAKIVPYSARTQTAKNNKAVQTSSFFVTINSNLFS